MFDELNARFFAGELESRIWMELARVARQFGSFDPGPNQILLNRRMDRPEVRNMW